jgi:hypothetical protein
LKRFDQSNKHDYQGYSRQHRAIICQKVASYSESHVWSSGALYMPEAGQKVGRDHADTYLCQHAVIAAITIARGGS